MPSPLFWKRTFPNAEFVETNPIRMEQPRDVMVGLQQQTRRVHERFVRHEQAWVDVPVWRNDRQFPNRFVQTPSRRADNPIWWQQAIRVQR